MRPHCSCGTRGAKGRGISRAQQAGVPPAAGAHLATAASTTPQLQSPQSPTQYNAQPGPARHRLQAPTAPSGPAGPPARTACARSRRSEPPSCAAAWCSPAHSGQSICASGVPGEGEASATRGKGTEARPLGRQREAAGSLSNGSSASSACLFLRIRYAMQRVAERDTPAPQCTSTPAGRAGKQGNRAVDG